MRIFGGLSILGCFLLLPILVPVNSTNGYNLQGFEIMSFSNVINKNRFFAHVFLSWIYFGLIIFVIYKELYYYVTFRQALQTTPLYDGLLSSRTIILTGINEKTISQEGDISSKFPNANNIIFNRNYTKLSKLCKERNKTANKLENILNKVIRKSCKIHNKWSQKGILDKKLKERGGNADDFETYIGKRPSHKIDNKILKFIPVPFFMGKSVDSIGYFSKKLFQLNKEISSKQKSEDLATNFQRGGSCFIEFKTQYDAQKAYQGITSKNKELSAGKNHDFDQALIGYSSQDIVWDNIDTTKAERYYRRIIGNIILCLMIIFWAVPVAVIGCISNINFLTDRVPFLRFINNMPDVIMGIITGLLPTILLALLMSLVPIFVRAIGRFSKLLTKQEIEKHCQNWYYAFQVIQVFLVTTTTSSASSTVDSIINQPNSAMSLLAQNLPKSANFYIFYFILQGLTVPTGNLSQIPNLLLSKILGRALDKTPRKKWTRYNKLPQPNWGVVYPVIELLIIIYICYSLVAPIILIFSTLCLCTMYLAYLYNLNYVFRFQFNSRGENYVTGLYQVFVGLYLAEICLIGLFVMAKSWGPVVLEAFFLGLTVLCHLWFQKRFLPLINVVPVSYISYCRGNCEYPTYKDQGLRENKETAKDFCETLELQNSCCGGKIQPVTEDDLRKAHYLPENDSSSSNTSLFKDDNKTKDGYDLAMARDSTTLHSLNLQKKNSTITDNSTAKSAANSKKKSTFFEEKDFGDLHKLHYADVRGKVTNPFESIKHEASGENTGEEQDLSKFTDLSTNTNTNGIFTTVRNFFRPDKLYTFNVVRQSLPGIFNYRVKYSNDIGRNNYVAPCVQEDMPVIWLAKDPYGMSDKQIIYGQFNNIDIRNDGAGFDETSWDFVYTRNPPNFKKDQYV
ncbi:related to Phosphate metabolism protein 7 [Saccharomycodes ludwigii]|uniref:Related to Phosphate metabolism protein 7 n=2 Tax=Saccharomycodes ludwigii TaxID=36035 RepID=A0A376B673_9ASCO|nr:related to Phosphate metabolism protein 7 [Saccharomycodes ludwigii]